MRIAIWTTCFVLAFVLWSATAHCDSIPIAGSGYSGQDENGSAAAGQGFSYSDAWPTYNQWTELSDSGVLSIRTFADHGPDSGFQSACLLGVCSDWLSGAVILHYTPFLPPVLADGAFSALSLPVDVSGQLAAFLLIYGANGDFQGSKDLWQVGILGSGVLDLLLHNQGGHIVISFAEFSYSGTAVYAGGIERVAEVPEPSIWMLVATGLGLIQLKRRLT